MNISTPTVIKFTIDKFELPSSLLLSMKGSSLVLVIARCTHHHPPPTTHNNSGEVW